MADATIELGIKPVLDAQGTKSFFSSLEKELRSARSGSHSSLTKRLSNVIYQMYKSGEASTTTQARMIISDVMGGGFSSTAKSILRRAQNLAQTSLTKENRSSQIATQLQRREAAVASGLSSAYDAMMMRYDVFKGTPSESNRDKLLNAVLAVNTHLSNLSKDRKTEIKNISKIQQDTKAIGKEAAEFKFTKPSATANAFGAAAFLKGAMKGALGILGMGSIWGAIKTVVGMGVQGIQEGYNDLVEQSIYGANRNIAGTRSLSKMYGIKEESLTGAERYALDFRQRMIMGEVSDREFLALSRMGSLGQMIVSGEAARNPQNFHKYLQEYIRANKGNEAEVRQNLRFLGLNPDIMAYGAIEHTAGREGLIRSRYEELVRQNKLSALGSLLPAEILKTAQAEIRAVSAHGIRTLFSGPESEALLYRSMSRGSGFRPEEITASYAELEARRREFSFDPANWMANAMTTSMRGEGNIGIALYEKAVQTQAVAAKEGTRDGAKEGAKEGIIEGLEQVLSASTSHSNDRTIMGMMNFTSSNREAG